MKKLSIATILVFVVVTAFLCVGCQTDLLKFDSIDLNANNLSYETSGIIDCDSGIQPIINETKVEVEIKQEETKEENTQKRNTIQIRDTRDYMELKGELKNSLVRITGENSIEELGDRIIKDGVYYYDLQNNPKINLTELGYKHLFVDDPIDYDPSTQKLERYYYDDGELIHRAWKIVDLTQEELEAMQNE